ncbi:MAG TPA: hypothetical protein VLH59_07380 [Ignavibacteriaceae bacterium]|nr:hypothetical protein [Ignavibacteriaceae bacterium]
MRKILLIEPNYLNKYPPLGLMKLSAYHKLLGDKVFFYKGDFGQYFIEERYNECFNKLTKVNGTINENKLKPLLATYLKKKNNEILNHILEIFPAHYRHTVTNILSDFSKNYVLKKKWDRVYVTTLFTFYWIQTKEAIEFSKKVVKSLDQLYVGGVAASLIPDIVAKETGLEVGKNIITGLLDQSGVLDENDIIVDELTPDYSILETIEHKYPLDTGYLTYMTRGCTRTCSFCAVPKLEPIYKDKISISKQLNLIKKKHGDRKDLILMDNNVLGSPLFPKIIEEIIEMGFGLGSKFTPPNKFEILCNYLKNEKDSLNASKYISRIYEYLNDYILNRISRQNEKLNFASLLAYYGLHKPDLISKESILQCREELNEYVEKYRIKSPKNRYVDFNQGIDCRYVDEEKMKLLSQIPIRPMRIAFDHVSLKDKYIDAIRLADKYGVKELSNYILFNYVDKPEDLWLRLKINVDLHKELNSNIFSFPMKFIPLYGYESLNRKYIGKHWNRKYLRAVQCVLNVTKGIGMPGTKFFERAFGKNIDEYFEILKMPEPFILWRNFYDSKGMTDKWRYQLQNLTTQQLGEANKIILSNDFNSFNGTTNKSVVSLLKFYQLSKSSPHKAKIESKHTLLQSRLVAQA